MRKILGREQPVAGEDTSVHSTAAGMIDVSIMPASLGLNLPANLGSKKGRKKSFGSFGDLRRSLPKKFGGKSMSLSSFRSVASSTSLSSSEHSLPQFAHGSSGPVRLTTPRDANSSRTDSVDTGYVHMGVAQAVGKKDQDRYDIRLGGENGVGVNYFGVFDGHGTSALAADLCADALYDELAKSTLGVDSTDDTDSSHSEDDVVLSTSSATQEPIPMPEDEAIVNAFLRIDQKVAEHRVAHPRAGTCAVALLLEQEEPANMIDGDSPTTVNGKVAWVGDCRCMMINARGDITDMTLDHRIDVNESEHQRILEADHAPRPGLVESELWSRELERAASEGRGQRPRAHSFVAKRELNGRPTGPSCVFSHSGGVSLQVTRSIGDVFAARSIIAEPDVNSFSVPVGEYVRFVLGSDGVFDCMDPAAIAKFVNRISNPRKAAQKLAAHAKQKRLYSGMSVDDITVLVVDINPDARSTRQLKTTGNVTTLY